MAGFQQYDGWRFAVPTSRIDGAVAAVMAVHRAAELAGAARPDIYI